MSRATVADMRRTLTPGTRVKITNHRFARLCRETVVTSKTNTVNLVTWGENPLGRKVEFHAAWPKAERLTRDDAGAWHVADDRGQPFLVFEILA